MSRIVSMKLVVVQRPTSAPSQSNIPDRASSTSAIGFFNTLATSGGTVCKKATTAVMPSSVRPKKCATAAATMKKGNRSEEHTSELQSLMRISYAVFCLKKTHINIIYTQIINMKSYTLITIP